MVGAFPKISALGTKYVQDIFLDEVELTEKLDGSQLGFGKVNGELIIRSKGTIINQDSPDNLFKEGVATVQSIADRIPDNMFFYGEYFKKPRHNKVCYDRIPKHHIALFGAVELPDRFIDDHVILTECADKLDVEVVPLLFRGKVPNQGSVMSGRPERTLKPSPRSAQCPAPRQCTWCTARSGHRSRAGGSLPWWPSVRHWRPKGAPGQWRRPRR